MKLKDLSEAIATACNVRSNVVGAVQAETFKQLRAALDKGERVMIPDFGIFMMKDVAGAEGEPGKKVVKFRMRSGEDGEGKGKGKGKKGGGGGGGKNKNKKKAGAADDDAADED